MALRTARFRPDRGRAGLAGVGLSIAFGVTLAGCDPAVEAWRSANGISRNDPDPATAPFTQNLAAGEAGPYPNLASVPPPPTRATSTAERQKLAQSLIADRAATAASIATRQRSATASGAALPAGAASPGVAASGAAAAGPGKTASNSPQSGQTDQPGQSGRRRAGEPPEPSPLESTLEMPDVRGRPEPEAARAPPPPPGLAAIRPPAMVTETPPPAALASVAPAPPPPVPDMAPLPPPPPVSPSKAATKRTQSLTTVATLAVPSASAAPSSQDQAQIARVAELYKDAPGNVRVIAYAATPAAGGEPLAGYQAALDRAQAVAKALAAAGIPAGKIQSEAAPSVGARQADRVEIQFAQ
jgi:hypothetical protein